MGLARRDYLDPKDGQSGSALPGYFRHQLVPLLQGHHPRQCQDNLTVLSIWPRSRRILRRSKWSVIERAADRECARRVLLFMTRSGSSTARHSITSAAATCRVNGTVRPSALAVLRLITSSNFIGCWTGRLAGLSPRKIRSIYDAARRNSSTTSIPYESKPPIVIQCRYGYTAGRRCTAAWATISSRWT